MAYEAYLDQEILTVLLHTEYTDGQSRCQLWIFDLAKGGVLINDTCELTERLMGMDYASFLYSLYINNTNLDETKRKVVAFLDGEQVDSEPVDLDAFSTELRQVLSELEQSVSIQKSEKSNAIR